MVISSPCLTDKKELASPKQTALGKHISNPLIVDSLLKPIWFINAPCFCNKSLAIPGQTATAELNELTELCIKLSEKGQTFGRSAQVYNKEEKGTKFEDYCWRSFSTTEEFLSTDEEIAQKLNEEEMTKAVAREGSRKYCKIIRVRDVTMAYQSFEDILKGFDREDLVALWSLVKERFRFAESTEDIEKSLWFELKRLFEP
ncbi:hypothetical protein Tco_0385987 [Tanacetum coccineum]